MSLFIYFEEILIILLKKDYLFEISVFGTIPTTSPALQIVEKLFRVAFEPQGVSEYKFLKESFYFLFLGIFFYKFLELCDWIKLCCWLNERKMISRYLCRKCYVLSLIIKFFVGSFTQSRRSTKKFPLCFLQKFISKHCTVNRIR